MILDRELDDQLLNEFHIGASFTRLARHKKGFDRAMQQSPVIERLVLKVLSMLERDELPARGSANVFWAIASLGEKGGCLKELIPPLTQNLVIIQSQSMKPQEVANAIWALATLQLPDTLLRSVLPLLACRVQEQISEFNAQDVANTIWATATLKGRAPELLEIHDVLAEMAAARAEDLNPQALANILWSAATLKTDTPLLLEVLPRLMEGVFGAREKYNAQNIANIIWAIAALREEVPALQQLLPDILSEVSRVANHLNAQEASNILWAGATLRNDHAKLWRGVMPALRRASIARLSSANKQNIANSAWALALLDDGSQEATEALNKFTTAATAVVGQMTPQQLANICHGFALRGIHCFDFLDGGETTLAKTSSAWTAVEKRMSLPVIAWAFAKLGIVNKDTMQAVVVALEGSIARMKEWRDVCVVVPDLAEWIALHSCMLGTLCD